MAIKSIDEIMQSVNNVLGESNSDDSLALIEDISDTLNDYETRTHSDIDWEQRYNENDAQWRQRYRERFFSGTNDDNDFGDDKDINEPEQKLTFESLFKEG